MKQQKKYNGVVVPMVTPFTSNLQVDTAGIKNIIEHIISAGAHPFVAGTTGEAASISSKDKLELVKHAVKVADTRAVVYAGISGNCLGESITDAKAYHDLGVDAVVATAPFYYPVSDTQLIRYFETLASHIPCPLILYNIPATTHLSIPIEVVDTLSHHDNIVGFKDSEKGMERIDAATALWKDRNDFSYLLGWALQSAYAVNRGADGIVPSSGNLIPAVYKKIFDAAIAGDTDAATKAQAKADAVSLIYQKDRTLSYSLSAFKVMLSAYALCERHMLPPLYRLEEKEETAIRDNVLATYGDLQQINSI